MELKFNSVHLTKDILSNFAYNPGLNKKPWQKWKAYKIESFPHDVSIHLESKHILIDYGQDYLIIKCKFGIGIWKYWLLITKKGREAGLLFWRMVENSKHSLRQFLSLFYQTFSSGITQKLPWNNSIYKLEGASI